MIQNLIDKSMSKSPWIFHINAGSCNGCDIELVSVLTPRYDAERLGFKLAGSPRHADIVVVTGPVTNDPGQIIPVYGGGEEIRDALLQVRQQARDQVVAANAPKAAVTCPYCGATTTPDASGCCEFCGGAVIG